MACSRRGGRALQWDIAKQVVHLISDDSEMFTGGEGQRRPPRLAADKHCVALIL